jgi:hypothetical protein
MQFKFVEGGVDERGAEAVVQVGPCTRSVADPLLNSIPSPSWPQVEQWLSSEKTKAALKAVVAKVKRGGGRGLVTLTLTLTLIP